MIREIPNLHQHINAPFRALAWRHLLKYAVDSGFFFGGVFVGTIALLPLYKIPVSVMQISLVIQSKRRVEKGTDEETKQKR